MKESCRPNYEGMYDELQKKYEEKVKECNEQTWRISELEVQLKDSKEINKRLLDQNNVLQMSLTDSCGEIRGLKFAIEHFAKGV